MASLTTASPRACSADGVSPASTGRLPAFLRHPIGLALVSAGLLWVTFPPLGWHAAAWFALVPLFLCVANSVPRRSVVVGSMLAGFAFWLLAVQWVLATDSDAWPGWLAMALALSLFWVAFAWASRSILRRTALPLSVVAPVVWVALEYLRAHVLTGFPWYYLAHSQYQQIYWTQIADLTGSLGLSLLIAAVNAVVAECLIPFFPPLNPDQTPGSGSGWRRIPRGTRVRAGLVVLSLGATLAYGVYRVQSTTFRPGPRVAMLQSSEVQQYNPAQRKPAHTLHRLYLQMVENALADPTKPDLVVWPETAFPYGLFTIDPEMAPKALDDQARGYDVDSLGADIKLRREQNNAEFRRIIDRYKVPMMIGVTTHEFAAAGYARYNSAVLFRPEGQPQSYHKLHLVPFGEYIPLIDLFPWLIKLTPFTLDQMPTLRFGDSPTWFDLGSYRLAAAICFEDTIPHVVRRFFSEVPDDAQPDLIVNLSNEGWFHATSEHEMHLAISSFRCIENRVPMARAVNTGVSAMIDGNGTIVRSVAPNKQEVLTAVTPLDDRTALYSRWGDWLGQGSLAGTIGLLVLGWIAPKRSRTPDPDPDPA